MDNACKTEKISMKYYEMLCVLPGTMTEEEVKSSVVLISETIGKFDAENVTLEDMGKSRLAYPVKHIRYGYFQLFRFSLEESNIAKLEKEIRLLDNTLRIALFVCDPNNTVSYKLALDPTAPSAPPKAEREGRDDRSRTRTNKTEEVKEKKTTEEVVNTDSEEVKQSTVAEAMEDKKEVKEEPVVVKAEKTKMSVEDIDKKLDEILQDDMDKV
ncbi:MAG: 30S ribosomal protein S6 [Candidatus Magasanikbacteria bacterium RIFOXYD12_FULL_33_17]|nr:MAG: 30S ribosomal protein S6 [Candidatus Magasanikbacteria bacterium RIFOXYD12_FULL_33_17]